MYQLIIIYLFIRAYTYILFSPSFLKMGFFPSRTLFLISNCWFFFFLERWVDRLYSVFRYSILLLLLIIYLFIYYLFIYYYYYYY